MKKLLHFKLALVFVLLNFGAKAQYDGCNNAVSHPVTLPYSISGQTTCGLADNFNGTISCSGASSVYTTGPDIFYAFTATTTGSIMVQYTTTATYEYPGLYVFLGCPSSSTNATNCVAATSSSTGNIGVSFNAVAGQTYVVMVDNWPTPPCLTTFGLYIGPTPSATLQGPCTNLGFESGTTGWFGTTGSVVDGATTAAAPTYVPNSYGSFGTQTTIMTSGTDPIGGFNCVYAGAQSLRIGDGLGTGSLGASVEQYFSVTNANSNFTYNYAVVLEDGGHPNYEQPFFQVEMYDGSGNPITCANYLITAPGTGFIQSTVLGYTDCWYKNWTTVSVNLLSYVGQNVRIKFTSGDCTQGGHFGYAYIDCSCASYTINPATICVGQSTTLSAPVGAQAYSWSPGGGTTSSISVSPSSTTVYTCAITSQGNTPCNGSLTTTVTVLPSPTVTATSASVCPGQGGTLTASGATSYTWSPGTGLSSTTGSTVTATPGSTTHYTVTGSNGSCSSTGTCTVTVISPPNVTVTSPTICKGSSANITAGGATTYSWTPSTGLSATTGAVVTASPTVTTTYTVIGTTGSCTSTATSIVTVNPTPTITVNSPAICKGNSTTLNASGASTYTWSPATGLSGTTGASVTANPTVTTTYTITGTSVGGCTATATSTVTVNPTPTLSVNSPSICVGSSTSLTASGANTYTWSPGTGLSGTTGSSVTANPGSTTVYTITGTSVAGCTATATSTLTVNPTPTVSVNSITMCPGNSATLTASGANTYTWSPGTGLSGTTGASVTASPTATTVYTITAASAAGCTTTATSTVTIGGSIVPSVNSATICSGGSATLTASGGTTYTWSPGTGLSGTSGTSVTANPAVTTTYTITAASGGCTGTTTAMVTVNAQPTVTVNSPSLCVGNSVTLTANGATTYSWSPATGLSGTTGTSVTANPTVTTTYTVVGTSATCTASATSVVTVNATPTITVNNGTVCNGGSVTLNASGASTYTWSPGTGLSGTTGSSVTANPSSTTNYTITGTSAAGCVGTATTTVTVVTNPTVTPTSATICVGGSVTLTASGASSYSWTPGTGLSSTNTATVTANPGSTTVYTVTGTAGTCTSVASATVTVNPLPAISVNSGTICTGQQTATLTASGGSTYTWSPATGLSGTTGTSVTATPTATSQYTVTGTDVNGCVNTATTAVTVNPLPTITANSGIICNGSSATLNAGGASTYTWSPATGLSGTTGSSVTANPPSTTHYTITGTDANGCTNTDTTSVTVISNPTVTPTSITICAGDSAALTATGANTYTWSPGTGLGSTTGAIVMASPASTTAYTVTGTAGSCTATATATVTVNTLPTISVTTATICQGQQTATLTASGANTYTWSPAGTLSGSTGSTVTGTPIVTTSYTVTGTDANGCVNTGTTTILVNALPAIVVNSDYICAGSTSTLTATGGTTYTWSPGTYLNTTSGATVNSNPPSTITYTINGTDANGCNNTDTAIVHVIANPVITPNSVTVCVGDSAQLSAAGASSFTWTPGTGLNATSGPIVITSPSSTIIYTVTGTLGTCSSTGTATVTVNPLPVVNIGSNSPLCVNQNLNLTSSGGTAYSWSGPGSYTSTTQNPTINSVVVGNGGIYTVTVTDANSCINTNTVSVVVNPLPVVTVTGDTVCLGFTINLTSNGGVTYSWSGPNNYSSNQQNPSITNAQTNMSGNYVVTVTDANGCASGNVATVLVNPSLVISAGSNSPVCQNGTLNLTSSSGVSWSWSGPGGFTSFSQNPSIPNVQVGASGTYIVTGTDANGCQGTDSALVVINALPVVTASSATICVTQQTANLTANGAITYTWSPASTLNSPTGSSVNATPLVTTVYTITATDVNNCVNTTTTSVVVNPLPTITANSGVICFGNSTTLTANGAVSYSWSPATGLSSASGSPVTANPGSTTTYTITGTDANGCYNTGVTTVTVNPLPVVTVNSGTICAGATTTLNALGANTYAWTPSTGLNSSTAASVTASPANTTTYVVTGTDINGCNDTAMAIVTVNPLPILNVAPQTSSGCAPVCVSLANGTSTTGSCSWDMGDGSTSTSCTPSHCYTIPGNYIAILTFTDNNGCLGTDSAQIIVYPVPDADFNYSPQPTTIFESNIQFTDASTGAVISAWNWNFGDPLNSTSAIPDPAFNYLDPGSYPVTLVVTSNYGCVDSVTKIVVIGEDYMIYVPNAFTPNFDGVNDMFFAKGEGVKDFKLYIFDRWGEQIFFADDIDKGWDGRFQAHGNDIVQEDVYVWKIELTNFRGEPKQLKGTVSLIK